LDLDQEAGQECSASVYFPLLSSSLGRFSNFLGVEDGQEFFEVVEHLAPVPWFGKPQG
jgi:hypothetical protein